MGNCYGICVCTLTFCSCSICVIRYQQKDTAKDNVIVEANAMNLFFSECCYCWTSGKDNRISIVNCQFPSMESEWPRADALYMKWENDVFLWRAKRTKYVKPRFTETMVDFIVYFIVTSCRFGLICFKRSDLLCDSFCSIKYARTQNKC